MSVSPSQIRFLIEAGAVTGAGFFTQKNSIKMKIISIDKNLCYTMEIEKCQWSSKNISCISFELNNLSDNKKNFIPNETTFIMSIEDATEFYGWLSIVINKNF